ncbi:hypothetical protein AaE_012606, partial [Aphanomyces astaci]
MLAIGIDKISGVVTDNAACMRAAWKILEDKYPGLICNRCAAHALNLLVKDVCKLEPYATILESARHVTSFVKDRNALTKRLERIQQHMHVDGELSAKRALSTVVQTRWYTQYNCLVRVLENRGVLVQLVVSAVFKDIKGSTSARQKKTEFSRIVEDASFWSNLEALVVLLRPTCSIIGKLESNSCCLSDVYRVFLQLREHWQSNVELTDLVMDRWAFIHTESMGFAFFLDPATRAGEGMFEDDLYDNSRLLVKFIVQKKKINPDRRHVLVEIAAFVDAMKNPSTKARSFIEECVTPMTYWHQVGPTKQPI